MRKTLGLLGLFGCLVLGQIASAADPIAIPEVMLNGRPGAYTLHVGDSQQTMKIYHITSLPPDGRSSVEMSFTKLLALDGQGGRAEVAVQEIDGQEVIVLMVSATQKMQESIAAVVEGLNQGKLTEYLGGSPEYLAYKPKYRSAKALGEMIEAELSDEIGVVHVDEVANIVTIEDEPFIARWLISDVLPAFDVPLPQAQILVQVVEVETGFGSQVGPNWNAFQEALPSNIDFELGATRLPTGERKGKMRFDSFSTLVSGISPQALGAFFEFLESRGEAKILSQATVNVVNGEESNIEAGVRTPFTALVEDDNGNKKFRDDSVLDGISIKVTGTIAEVSRRLNVSATVNSIVGWSVGNLPMTSTSTVTGTVNLQDGNSIVISGLKRLRKVETIHYGGLDLLKVFPKKTKEDRTRDVLIIVHTLEATQEPSVHSPLLPSGANAPD